MTLSVWPWYRRRVKENPDRSRQPPGRYSLVRNHRNRKKQERVFCGLTPQSNEDAFYDEYKNTEGNLTRFDTIPSVIMVNTDLIGDIKIEGYEDLLNPELKGKIAFADPAASSSSFEHLVNMLYAMGGGNPDNGWDYVKQFLRTAGRQAVRRFLRSV